MKAWDRMWLVAVLLLFAGCAQAQRSDGSPVPSVTSTSLPSPTPLASPTLTPSPFPTFTPTPTPQPIELFEAGEAARDIGDWEVAVGAYETLLSREAGQDDLTTQSALRLAQVHMANGAYDDAIAVLEPLAAATSDSKNSGAIHLVLADALRASGAGITATVHYSQVLTAEPILAPYVHEWIGDSLYVNRVYTASAVVYTAALSQPLTTSQRVGLLEKLGLSLSAVGDYTGAMAAYDAILGVAQYDQYRARIMLLATETALVYGDTDEAYRRASELVAVYPALPQAYQALIILVEAGQPVDDMLRGMVDYYAEAYDPAVQAFARVIYGDPNHSGAPHYYAGLSFLEAGSPGLAIDEFELLIETHPDDDYVPDAWMNKALALLKLGRTSAAMAAYETGIDLYGGRYELPQVVWTILDEFHEAGLLVETGDYLAELADAYPNDSRAPEARFRSGLLHYRAGNRVGAQRAWQALTLWYPYDDYAQAAWYWLGKMYLVDSHADTGESEPIADVTPGTVLTAVAQLSGTLHLSATHALSRAVSLGPTDFYGLQAADLLAGRQPFQAVADPMISCTDARAQAEAESWLENWLGLDPGSDLRELPASLLNNEQLRRGVLLLDLGHFDEGRAELEQLRVATASDPLTQYRLALFFRDIGLYRSSIVAAATVWQLSPALELQELPRFLGCLVYPAYYSDLVDAAAAEHELSPLFVYALLRQESLFEGYATSYAAAHGLMQVIPPTGEYIAQSLGWPPDYETRDLYRPMVSVRFGVWYLVEQMGLAEGNLFVAMAAYNGGPGNALRWWHAAEADTDLFIELIGFSETRTYVRRIREHYAAYLYLYGQAD